jgi:hypothetical protein
MLISGIFINPKGILKLEDFKNGAKATNLKNFIPAFIKAFCKVGNFE